MVHVIIQGDKKIKKCRISNDKSLIKIGKLGKFSLTGTFNKTKKIYEKVPKIYLMDKKHSIDIDNYSDLKGYSNFRVNISD